MNNHEPVFIVGAPRSGTTLLSAMINSHSSIACGPETHFFNKLKAKRVNSAISDRGWPNKAVSLLLSLRLSGQNVTQLFDLPEDEIKDFLVGKQPSEKSMIEAICYQHALKKGKNRWAEKTPNHLLHLDQIRKVFPNSPIIRIIRDPRDSAISISKLPWGSHSSIANGYLWDSWYKKSKEFFELDPNTLTIRYEDLVIDPENELKKICDFIGETFEPTMLDTSNSGTELASPNETWKAQVNEPLDPSRLYAWKRTTEKEYARCLAYSCLDGIAEFGYELPEIPARSIAVYIPSPETVEQNENLFIRLANKGIRLYQEDKLIDTEELLIPNARQEKLLKQVKAMLTIWKIKILRSRNRHKTWNASELEDQIKQ